MNHVRSHYLRIFPQRASVLAALVIALPVIATANPKIATHAVKVWPEIDADHLLDRNIG